MAESVEMNTNNRPDASGSDTSAVAPKPTKNVDKETQTNISIDPFSSSKLVDAGPIRSEPTSVTRKHEILFDFPKLPTELRLKVYQHTFEPQVVAVDVFYFNINGGPYRRTMARRTSPVPIALQINRESRTKSLRYYERVQIVNEFNSFPIIYIHPENDLLKLRAIPEEALAEAYIYVGMKWLLNYLFESYGQKFTLILDGVVPRASWFARDRAPWDQGHIMMDCRCARKVFLNYTPVQADDGTLQMNEQDAENLGKIVAYTEKMKSAWSRMLRKILAHGHIENIPTLVKDVYIRSSFSGAVLNGYVGLLLNLETTRLESQSS
jgi:hypothetical protein